MLAVTYYIQVAPSLLMLVALQNGRHVVERLDLRFAVLADPIVVGRARTFNQSPTFVFYLTTRERVPHRPRHFRDHCHERLTLIAARP